MGRKGTSPLVGYNTNVRHRGQVYHIQTEDSGVNRPHIMTHLFADGGRIIASEKTSYEEQLGGPGLRDRVKELMRAQHKKMFIALRDGLFDEKLGMSKKGKAADIPLEVDTSEIETEVFDMSTLDSAADRMQQQSKVMEGARAEPKPPAEQVPRYTSTRPATETGTSSIFGEGLVDEKPLDEVILNYLAEDLDPSTE